MCLIVLLHQNELLEVRIMDCPIDYCSQLGIKCIKVAVGEGGSASLFTLHSYTEHLTRNITGLKQQYLWLQKFF